jgi:FkbM family methyltransferase
MINKLHSIAEKGANLLFEPGVIQAAVTWPIFSVTSFLMVSRLKRLGINPGTVIDVGANVGQFAVAAGKLFEGTIVHAFEPLPDCYLQLARTISRMSRIQTHQIALSDHSGEIEFYVNTHRHSSSALRMNDNHKMAFPEAREAEIIKVRASTLDEEFALAQLAGPVLLKLDVQGSEAAVLRGGQQLLFRVDYVLLELSFQPLYDGEAIFQDVVAILRAIGFHLKCAVDFLRDPITGACLQIDGLFGRDERIPPHSVEVLPIRRSETIC